MATFEYSVTGQSITTTQAGRLVSGTVGVYTVKFTFDSSWDGLEKWASFDPNPGQAYKQPLDANGECEIPGEVMGGVQLRIGAFGLADGQAYPTVWANKLSLEDGCFVEIPMSDWPEPAPIIEGILEELENKVDKPESATAGNVAIFDNNNNIIDGGYPLTNLPSNAEVSGLRLSTDGVTYTSAGHAVRKQVSSIANIINTVTDLTTVPVNKGYLNTSNGTFTATTGSNTQRTTDAISIPQGVPYTVVMDIVNASDETVFTNPRAICVYNADDSFSRSISIPSELEYILLSGSESYIRINYNLSLATNRLKTLNMFPSDTPDSIVTLNGNAIIPQIDPLKNLPRYIGARRCAIAFIIDGEYNRNATMEALFSSNGVKIGFAIPYTTNFPYNTPLTYRRWQKKGHEILAHTSYALADGNYADDVAEGYIKSAYTTLTNYGFLLNGLVGASGKIADKYIPTVKKYFRYCSSESNHSGSYSGDGAESCLFFSTDSPFHLWRYSLQTSTLEQMKSAVDRAISQTGLLLFYGHAHSTNDDYFTTENVQSLLDYIASKAPDIAIMTPNEAINSYYTIRYDDLIS